MVKYVTGTLAGGLVAYAWAMFAWAVLPFNMSHFSNIKDEEKVSAMISRSMPERGIYLLPGMPDTRDLDDKAAEKANLATMERRLQGDPGVVEHQGYDFRGQSKKCTVPANLEEVIACTLVYTESDAWASSCREAGYEPLFCGCHDWLCPKNISAVR